MRKRTIIGIIAILLVVAVCFAGCSFFGTSGALSKSSSSSSESSSGNSSESSSGNSGSSSSSAYSSLSREELESALTEYRALAESLAGRVDSLEDAVRESIVAAKTNIGGYAVTYVDSVMNITCAESQYNLGCQGTGFIISEDGYVITNNHVIYYEETVYDYDNIQRGWWGYSYGTKTVSGVYSTILAAFDGDAKSYTLQFVYRDPNYDLALCKLVEAPAVGGTWKAIPFYEGTVTRGDEILVLGNAQGFGLSATAGLVSATGKKFDNSPDLTFIQTDAAINGGNSGGPAINIYGGLIGVVNSKFVSTNIENMGFAIELTKLKEFLANSKVDVKYKTVTA